MAAAGAAAMLRRIALWRRRAVERRQFLAMDERALKDLGISRYDAVAEAAKPWWRA
jgi:uncharacterized protein YjiS (DUF1127 family)